MGEAGNTEVFQTKDTISSLLPRKEFEEPIQEYKDLLNVCLDENGNFTRREETRKSKHLMWEVWNGDQVLTNLLHEPEATQYQAMVLGLRPLFFQKTNYEYRELQ